MIIFLKQQQCTVQEKDDDKKIQKEIQNENEIENEFAFDSQAQQDSVRSLKPLRWQ